MRTKIVAGNWKMNCLREEALGLATEISGMLADEAPDHSEVILAPPFVHIGAVAKLLEGSAVTVAGQNCSSESSGAFTGEVSAPMLQSVGARWVIIGHSERRQLFHEGHDVLQKKTQQALASGLKVIFCCGETLEQRENGSYFDTVKLQLTDSLFQCTAEEFDRVVIAYEPVWAIGTGKTATSVQAQEMHAFIRSIVHGKYGADIANSVRILYGGSCNEGNAAELFAMPDVDGGLIGGASLKSRSFVNIIRSIPK